MLSSARNSHNFYGTVCGGNSSNGWDIRFDVLPHNQNVVERVVWSRLETVGENEEEKDYDHVPSQLFEGKEFSDDNGEKTQSKKKPHAPPKLKKINPGKRSSDEFSAFLRKEQSDAKSFRHFGGKYMGEYVEWKIMGDEEYIHDLPEPDGANEFETHHKVDLIL